MRTGADARVKDRVTEAGHAGATEAHYKTARFREGSKTLKIDAPQFKSDVYDILSDEKRQLRNQPAMRPVLDLMRTDRGYMLGRFLGLVCHLSRTIDPTDFHRHISEKPDAAVKRASLVLNFELEKIRANDPERAVVIRRRMFSIVEPLRSADMTAPLSFAEQHAFSQGLFLERDALEVGGII